MGRSLPRDDGAPADREPHPRLRLERFLPYRLSVLANIVSRSVARLYAARFGLTIPEWRAMAVLGRGEPLSSNEIAARTEMDKVQVSRAIGRMEKAGLVRRATDRQDRRRGVLRLSAAGLRIYERIVPTALGYEKRLIAALSEEERRALDRLLAKLHARAAELDTAGEG